MRIYVCMYIRYVRVKLMKDRRKCKKRIKKNKEN